MATSLHVVPDKILDPDSVNVSWLQRWRERHEIKSLKLHGKSADCKDFNGWLEENRELIANFPHDCLLNIHETAFFLAC